MWILLALCSALFAAVRRTNEKQLTRQFSPYSMGFAVLLLSLPISSGLLLLHHSLLNPFNLGLHFWLPLIIVTFGFYPINSWLAYNTLKHGELSKVLPIQSLWPVFLLLPAWLTLHETPTAIATAGIALTVLGVYALGLKGYALHHPLQPFREDKSSRYMLFGVTLITAAGVLDKIAINASNAIFYSFISTAGAVIALFISMIIAKENELAKLKSSIKNFGVIGSLQGASYTTYLMAIATGPIAYVTAVRSSNILIGSMLGILLLKEEFTLAKKLSFGLILSGGILLALGS